MTATARPARKRPVSTRPPDGRRDRGRRAPARGPDPERLAALLVHVWLEARAGLRPLRQLEPLVTPVVYRRLARQLPPVRDLAPPGRVSRVTACTPAAGVCEAAVTVIAGGRTTAIAVRVERHLGRWRAVELTAPETGLAPLTTGALPPGWRPRDAFDEVLADAEGCPVARPPRPRGTS